jgi:GMP synthase-like glutamine amidotransferase
VKEVEVWEQAAWMEPPRSGYLVLNSHRDQVAELPASARVLAGNDHCPVGMLAVGERMAGMQGHPEFTPAYAAALLEWRVERGIIPAEVAEAARPTFQLAPDRELLAGWISRFLSGEGWHG